MLPDNGFSTPRGSNAHRQVRGVPLFCHISFNDAAPADLGLGCCLTKARARSGRSHSLEELRWAQIVVETSPSFTQTPSFARYSPALGDFNQIWSDARPMWLDELPAFLLSRDLSGKQQGLLGGVAQLVSAASKLPRISRRALWPPAARLCAPRVRTTRRPRESDN